jgi:hypothetical protein
MLSAGREATCCRPFQPADTMSACRQRAACTRSWSRPSYSKFHTPERATGSCAKHEIAVGYAIQGFAGCFQARYRSLRVRNEEEEEDRVGRFDPQARRGWRFGEFTGRDTP